MLVLPARLVQIVRIAAVAFAVACVLTIVLLLPFWVFVVGPRQRAAQDERLAALPTALYLPPTPAPALDLGAVQRELDALIECDRDDPSLLLLRASARLDAGDRAAATADLQELAAAEPSPYLAAVAARYASTASGPLSLAGLPPPQNQVDFLVAGFHALHQGDAKGAMQLLAEARDFAPALRLQLVAAMALEPLDPDALTAAAVALEKKRGHATSTSRHAQGRALLVLAQFAGAVKFCEDSLLLRPAQPAVLHDLGAAEFGLGQLQQAAEHLQQALALQPERQDSRELLQKVQAALARKR